MKNIKILGLHPLRLIIIVCTLILTTVISIKTRMFLLSFMIMSAVLLIIIDSQHEENKYHSNK